MFLVSFVMNVWIFKGHSNSILCGNNYCDFLKNSPYLYYPREENLLVPGGYC